MSKVYVKVYAKMKDGNIRFYKDGYTDLRGCFDYTSLNTGQIDQVDALHVSEQARRAIADSEHPERVAGRVVGDPVREVGAHVVGVQHVDQ